MGDRLNCFAFYATCAQEIHFVVEHRVTRVPTQARTEVGIGGFGRFTRD